MNNKIDKILVEISAGELVDKITILEIKNEKILEKNKLIEINKELNSLLENYNKHLNQTNEIKSLRNELKEINLKLWDIEDSKRAAEKNNKFDEHFISLARNVYKMNDQRAKIKMQINILVGSNIKEVKSYY